MLPCIAVSGVGGVPRHTVSMKEPTALERERVQVTIAAPRAIVRAQLRPLITHACSSVCGTIGGIDVVSIRPALAGEGPEYDSINPAIYTGSVDFIVHWRAQR